MALKTAAAPVGGPTASGGGGVSAPGGGADPNKAASGRNDQRTRAAQVRRLQPDEGEIDAECARKGKEAGDRAVPNPGRYRGYAARRLT